MAKRTTIKWGAVVPYKRTTIKPEPKVLSRRLVYVVDPVGYFRPGIYRHYKGGHYTALLLVRHHETRMPHVLYVSHTTGKTILREYCPDVVDHNRDLKAGTRAFAQLPDHWTDLVRLGDGTACNRFQWVGPVA